MQEHHFYASIMVDATPHEAFEGINDVTKWWTENLDGQSHQINDEFTVRFGDVHYSRQKLIELIEDKKVVWLVTDSRLSFIKEEQEWTNTRIVFEIESKEGRTQIHFTHIGLVPGIECFEACSNAWRQYIHQSLKELLTTGRGQPTAKEIAANADVE